MKYMRSEFRRSRLATRLNCDVWIEQGGRDALEVAHERVRSILKSPAEPQVDRSVVAELSAIAAAAEREAGERMEA